MDIHLSFYSCTFSWFVALVARLSLRLLCLKNVSMPFLPLKTRRPHVTMVFIAEFYIVSGLNFCFLVNSLNYSFRNGELLASQKQTIITFPKKLLTMNRERPCYDMNFAFIKQCWTHVLSLLELFRKNGLILSVIILPSTQQNSSLLASRPVVLCISLQRYKVIKNKPLAIYKKT